MVRERWIQVLLFAICAACLAAQLLFPGFIGIANNGDFGKVYAYLCLAPRGVETNFVYFQPDYVWSAHNFWDSPYHSSETALAWVATRMARATREGAAFDIRWMGAIHSAVFLAALAVLLAALRGARSPIAIALAPVAIFTDVFYTSLLNSFYMDAAALCGLLLMTASAVWMAVDTRSRALPVSLFGAAALLFTASKVQHAIWMPLPAAWLIAWAACTKARYLRWLACCAAALVLLAGSWIVTAADASYRGQAMFNLLFYRLGPRGADLASLGVEPGELRYTGMHSYTPGAPVTDQNWTVGFYRRTGLARLLGWYARHPRETFAILAEAISVNAAEMRQDNLSNYRVEDGHPPGARTHRFAAWSDLRGTLLRRWPWHIVLWYALFIAGCLWAGCQRIATIKDPPHTRSDDDTSIRAATIGAATVRERLPRGVSQPLPEGRGSESSSTERSGTGAGHPPTTPRVAWVALGIATLGAGEFLAAALGDCLETARHLQMSQAATDLTVCFAVAWAIQKTMRHTP